ncbi:MAG TPA: LysM peptidoglycan-binding domain-containing M23 family metallopeptidase [Anaerolineae bacterium]|nr:LysM peptidoglycan-binding domain-containing M23 family metallopeptidase [Anaerolineae bacterium]
MISSLSSRPKRYLHRATQRWAVRLPVAALFALGLWAAVTPSGAHPALAFDDETPGFRNAPTQLAGDKPARVFLPLTVASPRVVEEQVDLVDFTYRLQEGDDLAMLALVWGVDSEQMACVTRSGQEALSGLRPGTVIMIANPRYRCHTVQPDETVAQIAQDYGVTVDNLLTEPWNLLETTDETLEPGRRLLILDGIRPDLASLRQTQTVTATSSLLQPVAPVQAQPTPEKPAVWPYGDGQFIWPVGGGVISQGFRSGHRAIDIAARIGTPVYAADSGIVIKSGYSKDGYGGRAIIDHQIDYVTLYAHLSQALVEVGDVVEKGQLIGYVGSTGNSTGPHIHFEIRDFGFLVDPRTLLGREE